MNRWRATSSRLRCPHCDNTHGCRVSPDGALAMCLRATSGIKKLKDGMGWLVRVGESAGAAKRVAMAGAEKLTATECRAMQTRFANGCDPKKLNGLAIELGLSLRSLQRLGGGYCHDRKAWTFPMYDGRRRICGFRTRDSAGGKRSITGSRNGIFIPTDLDLYAVDENLCETKYPLLLLLPEGPTDTAAALDLGFRAIGRPSNMGGADQIREFLASGEKQEVVIVADHDPVKKLADGTPFVPGWEGALHLAEAIMSSCGVLKICRPPGEKKDLRRWMIDGGFAEVFAALIDDTTVMTRRLLVEKQKRLDEWKRNRKRASAG